MICASRQFLLFSSMTIFLPKFCFSYEVTHIQQLDFLLHFNNLCLQLCMRILTMLSNSLTTWETIWISPQKKKSSSSSTAVCSRFSQTWMDSLHTSVCLTLPACLQELFFDAASSISVQEISLRFTNIFHRVSEWLGWNLWEFWAPCSSRDMDLLAQDCVQMAFLIISKDGDSKTSGLSKPPAFTVKKTFSDVHGEPPAV